MKRVHRGLSRDEVEALREKLEQMVPRQRAAIPEILRTMRLITRKSQVEYAKLCGLNPRVLADLERGTGNPSFSSLEKLLKPFGLAIGITSPQEMRAALPHNPSPTAGTPARVSPVGRSTRARRSTSASPGAGTRDTSR